MIMICIKIHKAKVLKIIAITKFYPYNKKDIIQIHQF